jgi:hypothetical protein
VDCCGRRVAGVLITALTLSAALLLWFFSEVKSGLIQTFVLSTTRYKEQL